MKYKLTKKDIKKCYKKARPKLGKAKVFALKRGTKINTFLAKPIVVSKKDIGILDFP